MARARNIKPGFYKNEDLAECSVWARLIFPGIWMLADREGRLEDRPKRIKGELLPFDSIEVDPLLSELERFGFILRYAVDGIRYIQITKFSEHQAPHVREAASTIPAPSSQEESTAKAVPSTNLGRAQASPRSPDSLNPSSLNPSSLNPVEPPPLTEPVLTAKASAVAALVPDCDSPIPDPPTTEAHWLTWFNREHGLQLDASSRFDRKDLWPIFKRWCASGVTLRQMRDAVRNAQETATSPIANLPKYVDRVIANQQSPPRISASDQSKLAAARAIFGTEIEGGAQHGSSRIIDITPTGTVGGADFSGSAGQLRKPVSEHVEDRPNLARRE